MQGPLDATHAVAIRYAIRNTYVIDGDGEPLRASATHVDAMSVCAQPQGKASSVLCGDRGELVTWSLLDWSGVICEVT